MNTLCLKSVVPISVLRAPCSSYVAVRRRGSYIFYTIGSQMAVRLSVLLARLSLQHAVETHSVVRRRGAYIF
jgi:hypothetical protein